MRRFPAALLVVVSLAAGCGGGDDGAASGPLPIFGDLARHAPDRDSYARPLGAALREGPARDDPDYLAAFVTTFTSMTPENALKWEVVQPERGEFDFGRADALVEAARRTGKRVRGHTLVWDQQLPAWVADGGLEPSQLAAVLREHVSAVVGRYRGRVAEWDVVNEPFEADGSWTRSVWYRVLGKRYVSIAFRAARRADPGARLFLNEAGAERPAPRARALRELARELRRGEVPIDGVGFQNHTTTGGYPRQAELLRTFRSYGRLGLATAITEMDVAVPPGPATPKTLAMQARAYANAARACRRAERCTGLTVWGVSDRYSWKGAAAQPLPIDRVGRPKPALRALLGALERN
ncbi:MAG: endo-1,4-beta-xylanase [Thermoleophilaceae bacterium]